MPAHHLRSYRPLTDTTEAAMGTVHRTTTGAYAVRVQGRLDPRWAGWFDGCTLTHDGSGTTLVTRPATDQAALHGVLQALRDLGLPLVSVTPVEPGRCPRPDA